MATIDYRIDTLADWVSKRLPIVEAAPDLVAQEFIRDFRVEESGASLGLDPRVVGSLVLAELRQLADELGDEVPDGANGNRSAVVAAKVQGKLRAPGSHTGETLAALLPAEASRVDGAGRRQGRPQRLKWWLERIGVGLWMNVLVLATIAVAGVLLYQGYEQAPALPTVLLCVFTIWALSFLPGWMFIRFIGQRAGALWDEYVLNLHRLGWDEPENLPRPPASSKFFVRWLEQGGKWRSRERNIYQQKFDAYYGKSVSRAAQEEEWRLRADTLFPVFLTALVFAVCWTALLWPPGLSPQPSSMVDMLKYAFLGAYSFIVQMLIRRFFQSDLRPSAYASAVLRIVIVLILVPVLHQLFAYMSAAPGPRPGEAVVAFVIGFFPLVAMQALQRACATVLHVVVPTLTPDYPLNQLDGLNVWYEARLLEEGIEDMQNLATANLVDVMLHTRVPVGRLVDWVDQAYLYIHLDRTERGRWEAFRAGRKLRQERDRVAATGGSPLPADSLESHRTGTRTRNALRKLGIRTATDLINRFPPDGADGEGLPVQFLRRAKVDPAVIRSLVAVLAKEPGLKPVVNWQQNGCPETR